jgi:hypothetical protein
MSGGRGHGDHRATEVAALPDTLADPVEEVAQLGLLQAQVTEVVLQLDQARVERRAQVSETGRQLLRDQRHEGHQRGQPGHHHQRGGKRPRDQSLQPVHDGGRHGGEQEPHDDRHQDDGEQGEQLQRGIDEGTDQQQTP